MTADTLGRRLLLGVAGVVVVLSGMMGFVVGANGASVSSSIRVFGVLTLPTTPGSLALYGVVLSTVVLAVLFSLVEFASRFEETAETRP